MYETFYFDKFENAENTTVIVQTYGLKYSNKTFLVRKLFFFVLLNFLHFGCWLLISQSFFFPIFSLKIPKKAFLVSNITIFVFTQKFFKLLFQNYTNKAFLIPKLKLFALRDCLFHKSESTDSNYQNFLKILV